MIRRCAALLALSATISTAIPTPAHSQELAGNLSSTGSDTLGSLSSVWAEMVQQRYPQVLVEVRAIGSAAAPTALIQGTADIGPMSRPMSAREIASFRRRYGYAPTAVSVAKDALAVFVHRDNPLQSIAIPKLDALFSVTRLCGHPEPIVSWGELGLLPPWDGERIHLYGRTSTSGTYSVFRRQVMCGGDFSPHLNRLVGSSAIVRAVAADPSAIGYASAGYLNANVRPLVVVGQDGKAQPSFSRSLYIYINRPPEADLSPLVRAYMDIALSREGQREVIRSGYLALTNSERNMRRLGLGLKPDA